MSIFLCLLIRMGVCVSPIWLDHVGDQRLMLERIADGGVAPTCHGTW